MFQSNLHIEIADDQVIIHANTDDDNDGAAYVLTPEQALELAQKLMVSAQVSAKSRSARFAN